MGCNSISEKISRGRVCHHKIIVKVDKLEKSVDELKEKIINFWLGVVSSLFWSLVSASFHGGSCSSVLLKFIFITYVAFFFQMLHVNMLQHLFWASVATFNFMLFSHYFLIFQITSWLIIPSQHQCIGCNFRPHNVKSNNDMFIYMLLIHNFLIIFHDIGLISITIFFLCFKLFPTPHFLLRQLKR